MKPESAKVLAENIVDARIYEEYSGRYMYGKTTTGIVIPSLMDTLNALGENLEYMIEGGDYTEALDLAKALQDITSWDSMGRDKIIIY